MRINVRRLPALADHLVARRRNGMRCVKPSMATVSPSRTADWMASASADEIRAIRQGFPGVLRAVFTAAPGQGQMACPRSSLEPQRIVGYQPNSRSSAINSLRRLGPTWAASCASCRCARRVILTKACSPSGVR